MAEARRKIAALLAADVVGHARLMEADANRTLEALRVRREIFAQLVNKHEGREFGSVGDSLMAEFPSAVNAVLCALAVQRAVRAENETLPREQRLLLRMGLNLGDVLEEHGVLYGEGVNIASRLQTLAPPGGIFLAGSVYEQVKHQRSVHFRYAGQHSLKNVSEPLITYQVVEPGVARRTLPISSELRRRNVLKIGVAYSLLAWLIVELSSIVLPDLAARTWLLRALAALAVGGLPGILYVAWRYQLTPTGLRRREDALRDGIAPRTGRRLEGVLTGLLIAAAVLLVLENHGIGRRSPEAANLTLPVMPVLPRSIAVLPFHNRGADGEDAAFFADGIHDDLLALLFKLRDIRAISRTSVERYRNSDRSIREIAEVLGVSSVLEGGVSLAGDNVRVNVRLIDPATETELWAEIYDRELTATNVFGIQSEVAAKIADSLEATLSAAERQRLAHVPTRDLEAYEAYLLAKQQMNRRTSESIQAAIDGFQRAIGLDPEFALAYVGLADSYTVLQNWGHLSRDAARSKIREATATALRLDDQLGEAYVSLAALYELDHDLTAAGAAYERALALNPGYATARAWYSLLLLLRLGRWEEAVEQAEQAVALDPLSPLLRIVFGSALSAVGSFDEELAQYRRSTELDPDFGFAYKSIGNYHLAVSGRLDEAVRWYRSAVARTESPNWIGDVGGVYLMLGDLATAETWIRRARRIGRDNFHVEWHEAFLNTYLGRDALAETAARRSLAGPFDLYVPSMLFILRNADLRAGRHIAAQRRYERTYPGLAEEEAVVHRSNVRAAIDLSLVLDERGDRERARRLRAKSLPVLRTMPRLGLLGYGIADAEIYALEGRRDEALSALRSAVEEGWRWHWYLWTELNPNLEAISDTAAYRAIIDELERDAAFQLERIREEDETRPPRAAMD